MLKISWAEINDMGPVCHVLANSPKVDRTASYRAGRIVAKLQQSMKHITEERRKIWEKYCDRDEKLDPKKNEEGNLQFSKPEAAKACAEEVKTLFETNFIEVKCFKLPYEGVRAHLNGQELVAIENILEGVPEEV